MVGCKLYVFMESQDYNEEFCINQMIDDSPSSYRAIKKKSVYALEQIVLPLN